MTDSKAIARYDGPRTVDELERYSRTLAVNVSPDGRAWANAALPATFRGNPASVAFAVEYAKALDVSPVTAIIGIHIVDGKPTASAGLISALVRRAGHKLRTWVEGTIDEGNAVAVTTIVRADDPDFTYRSEWTVSRAVRAGLLKRTEDGRVVAVKDRSAWATYPESMLKARSITECARDAAEDAILGVHYTPEELGADVDPETGDVVHTVPHVPAPGRSEPTAPAPRPEPTTPAPAPETKHEEESHVETVADTVRALILSATTRDQLAAVWAGKYLLGSKTAAEALTVADENGVLTTAYDLLRRAGQAIGEGRTLTGDDRGGDAGQDPALPSPTPEGDDDGAAETPGVKRTVEELTKPPAQPGKGPKATALDAAMHGFTNRQTEDVIAWARLNEADPHTEDGCDAILAAIQTGEAFSTEGLDQLRASGETPVELVERVLDAVVVSEERVDDPAEAHAREMEERRREAAETARPPHRGRAPKGAGRDAYRQARQQSMATGDDQ